MPTELPFEDEPLDDEATDPANATDQAAEKARIDELRRQARTNIHRPPTQAVEADPAAEPDQPVNEIRGDIGYDRPVTEEMRRRNRHEKIEEARAILEAAAWEPPPKPPRSSGPPRDPAPPHPGRP